MDLLTRAVGNGHVLDSSNLSTLTSAAEAFIDCYREAADAEATLAMRIALRGGYKDPESTDSPPEPLRPHHRLNYASLPHSIL